MAKTAKTSEPTITRDLTPERTACAHCGGHLRADYANHRTLHTLAGVTRLNLTIRRCHRTTCPAHKRPYRPEVEGSLALPHHEFGLDVVALVGCLRYAEHRSVPEIRAHLVGRKVAVSERTVTNLLDRYDELLAVSLTDDRRLKKVLAAQGRVILAVDGLQPDVGHEVLWVIRDCLSGEILLAKSLLSARQQDLAALLLQVRDACPVVIAGVVSDGQHSIRKAVGKVFRGVPYQLCQFHYLREAGRPIYEADRHAKKELKKKVRGVRIIERQMETPLEASGLKLHTRLSAIAVSLDRAEKKGGFRPSCND
jgi:Transposase, Mutator family